MSQLKLPAAFAHLGEFASWAIPTEQGRHEKRMASSMEEVRAFYDAMTADIDAVFKHLASVELEGIDTASENLLLLTLATQEVALCVENFGELWNPEAWPLSKVKFHQVAAKY